MLCHAGTGGGQEGGNFGVNPGGIAHSRPASYTPTLCVKTEQTNVDPLGYTVTMILSSLT